MATPNPDYSVVKTLTKGGQVAVGAGGSIALAAAVLALLRGTTWGSAILWKPELDEEALIVFTAIGGMVLPMLRNWWKNRTLVVALLCGSLLLGGCATVGTKFSETITDENGVTTATVYKASSIAPPFGKLETTNHLWNYRWGGEENEIATGQAAEGIDNTGWTVLAPVIESIIQSIADAYKTANTPVAQPLPEINVAPVGP